METAKEMLIFEPMLYSDLDKYIWISDSYKVHREAQRFFVCMLKKGIYVKGFATDNKSMVGLEMYNKKIFDINTLDQKNSMVFYDTYLGRFDVELPEKVCNARILNPELQRENIAIWGSGITGKRVYKILSENGIKVECYVDSNKELEGTCQYGLQVYTPAHLEEFAEPPTIVEAMERWEELDMCIGRGYGKRFYFSFVEADKKKNVYSGHYITRMFDLMSWHENFSFFVGKIVYVYGNGEIERELLRYLKMLDISFGGFLVDEFDVGNNNDIYGRDYDTKYVEEILYEKEYFAWTCDRGKAKRLEELGLVSHVNYIYYDGADNLSMKKKHILDTNLGHNFLVNSKYPGIIIYGNGEEKDFRIAVLGGSTTDGQICSYKSWPELMYKELCDNQLENITIYNGGVSGYASGQELLKLIRDMIPLKPDMIIVYDGLNDLSLGSLYPLTSGYVKKVFDFASKNMEGDEDDSLIADKNDVICQGIEAKTDVFEAWLENIRTMYAIAKERNIYFYSFCQPMLGSKKEKTNTEKNILLSVYSPMIANLVEGAFRKRISQMSGLPEYIHDLSHIFDQEQDIYKDHVHLLEKGNQIIAREITKVILPKLLTLYSSRRH